MVTTWKSIKIHIEFQKTTFSVQQKGRLCDIFLQCKKEKNVFKSQYRIARILILGLYDSLEASSSDGFSRVWPLWKQKNIASLLKLSYSVFIDLSWTWLFQKNRPLGPQEEYKLLTRTNFHDQKNIEVSICPHIFQEKNPFCGRDQSDSLKNCLNIEGT